jgi:hypothetical protein
MSKVPPGMELTTYAELALALGGSEDSFTGQLLLLIAKADPGNRARLRAGFPRDVAAWELWMASGGHMTAGELDTALSSAAAEAVWRRMAEEWRIGGSA